MNSSEYRKAFSLPEIAASVMMRRTSFSIWELLQISSHVPLTCICSATAISCLWFGTTKLITYDWSLKDEHRRLHMFSYSELVREESNHDYWNQPNHGWKLKVCRSLPVGVGTDVVYERAVLQNSLHFSERDVLACLQLHQVLLAVCWKRTSVTILIDAARTGVCFTSEHCWSLKYWNSSVILRDEYSFLMFTPKTKQFFVCVALLRVNANCIHTALICSGTLRYSVP